MSKVWIPVTLIGILFTLSGCGGSSSTGSTAQVGGSATSQFQAVLPDGSDMEIEILDNTGTVWSGEFACSAETGPYAHQVGSFEGTVSGNTVNATCESSDGTEFQLTGTAVGDKSLTLTRSDIPGTVLNFTPVLPSGPSARADVTCNLTTGASSGKMTLSTSPYSTQGGGTMTEYRGKWIGLDVTFWAYSSGYGTLVTYVDPFCIHTTNYVKLKITDFGTATVASSSGQVVMYSSIIRAQVKFPGSATVSP